MKTADPAVAKAALRNRFRAFREVLPEAEYLARSTAICARVAALPEIEQAETIHVYWPLEVRREVDTRPLIRTLYQGGRRVILPVVAEFGGAPLLRHVAYGGESALRPNRWGLLEPEGPGLDPAELDAVVVPALGVGRNGHRIGHGRGFYDAFLAQVEVPAIGVVYRECLIDRVPAEAHDVPLNVVVTEREMLRISPP